MILDGHRISEHSYDHMVHNTITDSPRKDMTLDGHGIDDHSYDHMVHNTITDSPR